MPPVPDLLERIRESPGLYIGGKSITGLYHTVLGYELALGMHGIATDHSLQLPSDFHDWIAYRLHFSESTSGWKNMLLSATSNEGAAFDRFFELLDEYRSRKCRVVAKLLDFHRSYKVGSMENAVTKRYPSRISLIAYTEDPGFFVTSDEPGVSMPDDEFFPSLRRFETFMNVKSSQLTILDADTYQQWIAECDSERD